MLLLQEVGLSIDCRMNDFLYWLSVERLFFKDDWVAKVISTSTFNSFVLFIDSPDLDNSMEPA